jgi:hypothetical protein
MTAYGRILALALPILVLVFLQQAMAGKKQKIKPDDVQVFQKDTDLQYQVIGLITAGAENKDSVEVGQYLLKKVKKEAAKKGMNATIFTEIIHPKRGSLVEGGSYHRSIPFSFIQGIGVKLLDSTEALEWEKTHPRKDYDRKAEVEVLEGDVERCYEVRGIATAFLWSTMLGNIPEESEIDSALTVKARRMRCHAVIFTERSFDAQNSDGSGRGVMVRYKK